MLRVCTETSSQFTAQACMCALFPAGLCAWGPWCGPAPSPHPVSGCHCAIHLCPHSHFMLRRACKGVGGHRCSARSHMCAPCPGFVRGHPLLGAAVPLRLLLFLWALQGTFACRHLLLLPQELLVSLIPTATALVLPWILDREGHGGLWGAQLGSVLASYDCGSLSECGPHQGPVNPPRSPWQDLMQPQGRVSLWVLLPPAAPPPDREEPSSPNRKGKGRFHCGKGETELREVRVLGSLLNPKGVCAGWGWGPKPPPSPAQLGVVALLPAGP